MNINLN